MGSRKEGLSLWRESSSVGGDLLEFVVESDGDINRERIRVDVPELRSESSIVGVFDAANDWNYVQSLGNRRGCWFFWSRCWGRCQVTAGMGGPSGDHFVGSTAWRDDSPPYGPCIVGSDVEEVEMSSRKECLSLWREGPAVGGDLFEFVGVSNGNVDDKRVRICVSKIWSESSIVGVFYAAHDGDDIDACGRGFDGFWYAVTSRVRGLGGQNFLSKSSWGDDPPPDGPSVVGSDVEEVEMSSRKESLSLWRESPAVGGGFYEFVVGSDLDLRGERVRIDVSEEGKEGSVLSVDDAGDDRDDVQRRSVIWLFYIGIVGRWC